VQVRDVRLERGAIVFETIAPATQIRFPLFRIML